MHLLWLLSLTVLLVVCLALVWVYFCVAKQVEPEAELDFPDIIPNSEEILAYFSRNEAVKPLSSSMPFPRFVQEFD